MAPRILALPQINLRVSKRTGARPAVGVCARVLAGVCGEVSGQKRKEGGK
jgi:putative effector of murein hydrolase